MLDRDEHDHLEVSMKRVKYLLPALVLGGTVTALACGSSSGGTGANADEKDATNGVIPGSDGSSVTENDGSAVTESDAGRISNPGDGGTGVPLGTAGNGVDAFGFPIPPTSLTAAVAANNFLNSIGIHIGLGAGTSHATQAQYISLVQYIGARWARGPTNNSAFPEFVAIAEGANIKMSYQTWGSSSTSVDTKDIPNVTTLANAGHLYFVEGPNEPDVYGLNWNDAGGGKTGSWAPVAEAQSYWYEAIKKNATLSKYPVANITHSGAQVQNYGLQFNVIPADAGVTLMEAGTKYADYATMHNYVQWLSASTTFSTTDKDNLAWNNAAPTGHVAPTQDPFSSEYIKTWKEGFLGYSATEAPSVPRITTETGWPTSIGGATAEEDAGKVMLNVYLDQFARGYSLTDWYQLLDDEGGFTNTYGMYTDANTPKAVATYLHNMTTILADDTSAFATGTLNWSIANQPATVHGLLLQKSDKHFWLCITDEHWPAPATADSVVVSLGASYGTINIYDATVGTSVQKTASATSSVTLSMTDHPLFLEIY